MTSNIKSEHKSDILFRTKAELEAIEISRTDKLIVSPQSKRDGLNLGLHLLIDVVLEIGENVGIVRVHGNELFDGARHQLLLRLLFSGHCEREKKQ